MYNLERRLRIYDIRIYWQDIALATCCRSQPLLNINIDGNFQVAQWRHQWHHHHEKYCFGYNLGQSFHIWGQTDAVFHISKLPPFWVRDQLFYQKYNTGSWIYQQDSHEHFQYFELLIDALAEILRRYSNVKFDLFCDLVTSLMTSWIRIYTNIVTIPWYLYTFVYLCTGSSVVRSPSKPVTLPFDLQSRKVLFIDMFFRHI